jgi:hypothetical protein
MNVGSYYVNKGTDIESNFVVKNDSILLNYGAKYIDDSLLLIINIKLLNGFKFGESANIEELKFEINKQANIESKNEFHYLGPTLNFNTINSIVDFNKILSEGHPVKLIYRMPNKAFDNLHKLDIDFKLKLRNDIHVSIYESHQTMVSKTSYRLF